MNSVKELFRDRVHRILKDWGEPITATDVLKCMGIEETQNNRHRILCAISSLKRKDGRNIKATATGHRKGRVYELVNGSSTPPQRNKMRDFVAELRESDIAKAKKRWGDAAASRDSVDEFKAGQGTVTEEDKDDQTFEKLVESARQKEIAEDSLETAGAKSLKSYARLNPLLQEHPTKNLRAYETLCYHFIRSRKGMTSSIQVADYYGLTNEEGACLLTRVSKRFQNVELTVYARV